MKIMYNKALTMTFNIPAFQLTNSFIFCTCLTFSCVAVLRPSTFRYKKILIQFRSLILFNRMVNPAYSTAIADNFAFKDMVMFVSLKYVENYHICQLIRSNKLNIYQETILIGYC